ncbi:hypothetical protein W97_01575 [Coniosporium apollinis CBS 100218]|uniref:Potassium channel tetramerisation-type BTB domain-containing protein n=1 Tax=Coniosporium apollinis (strain CBS 100218) TaxID=1168221 RepID=R7YKL3_CONA1|nr:uncharacterized protein W97_01575 [Coniosporium apollinis CBS 100218]EON62354.1 hypothetical protein W97_01575 [Coniosporium apollinis CBS 100218]
MKRTANTDPTGDISQPATKRVARSPSSSTSGATPAALHAEQRPIRTRSQSGAEQTAHPSLDTAVTEESDHAWESSGQRSAAQSETTAAGGQAASTSTRRVAEAAADTVSTLPAGRVFPVQIGSELFKLSGASISSDAPSYFSQYFADQLRTVEGGAGNVKTLYIDRDPVTFKDISLHLQGYYVKPRSAEHFVRLFADAQFYSLPRLTQQLFKSDIFVQVGSRDFQIPRELFSSPGDSPNYFTLGIATFLSTPQDAFPGLDRQALLRPPPVLPPSVPNRSAEVFSELLKYLQGYPVNITDEAHRADLLRDARYFHLKGLEQRLLPVKISFNAARNESEIVLRLEDVRQSGISCVPNPILTSSSASSDPSEPAPLLASVGAPRPGHAKYARPFTNDHQHCLIIEMLGSEPMRLDTWKMRATFDDPTSEYGTPTTSRSPTTKSRLLSLFTVLASKMNLPVTQSIGPSTANNRSGSSAQALNVSNSGLLDGDSIRFVMDHDTFIEVDGMAVKRGGGITESEEDATLGAWQSITQPSKDDDAWTTIKLPQEWMVSRGQWRLRVECAESGAIEAVLCAVRIEATSSGWERNKRRGFLG